MTIVTDVMLDVITGVSSGVLDLNGTRERYTFDITDSMNATIPAWTPLNSVFSFGCDAVVDVAATGTTQIIMRGATAAGNHQFIITPSGVPKLEFKDAAGTTRSSITSTLVDGEAFSVRADYYPDKVELFLNGALEGTNNNAPELAVISSIAATVTPILYFGGTISNVFCTSSSPMQNVNVMAGNGTDRYVSIPTFSPVAFTTKQWVRVDDLSINPKLWGNTSSLAASRLSITTAGIVVLSDSNSTNLMTSSGVIIEGQDHYVETEVLADGSCEMDRTANGLML